jgi:hypothetical protein
MHALNLARVMREQQSPANFALLGRLQLQSCARVCIRKSLAGGAEMWILIYVIVAANGTPTTSTAELQTEQLCQGAGKVVAKMADTMHGKFEWHCLPKQ